MALFIFGGGPIADQILRKCQIINRDIFLVSSRFLGKYQNEKNLRQLTYGDLDSTLYSNQDNLCLLTTRMDLVDSSIRTTIMKDLRSLSRLDTKFMNLSTVAVYGSSSQFKNEDSEPNPQSKYGIDKLRIEGELDHFISPNRITHLRIANLFGLEDFKDLTNTAITHFREGRTLHLPLMECYRDFVPFEIFSDFILDWILERIVCSGPLNFSTGKSIPVAEWTTEIGKYFVSAAEVIRDLDETLPLSFVDNRKLLNIWGERFLDEKIFLRNYLDRLT